MRGLGGGGGNSNDSKAHSQQGSVPGGQLGRVLLSPVDLHIHPKAVVTERLHNFIEVCTLGFELLTRGPTALGLGQGGAA